MNSSFSKPSIERNISDSKIILNSRKRSSSVILPFGENVPRPNAKATNIVLHEVNASQNFVRKAKIDFVNDDKSNNTESLKRVKISESSGVIPIHYTNVDAKVDADLVAPKAAQTSPSYSSHQYIDIDKRFFESQHDFHREQENQNINFLPLFNNPNVQLEVTDADRRFILNWMYEVVETFGMSTSIIFLAVHFLDNTMRLTSMKREHFPLWSCTCMLVASKIDEVHDRVPLVDVLIAMAGSHFSAENLFYCEKVFMMLMCKHKINITTRFSFVHYYASLANLSRKESCFFHYLLELSLVSSSLSHEPYSKVCAAALHLALQASRDSQCGQIRSQASENSGLCSHMTNRSNSMVSTSSLASLTPELESEDLFFEALWSDYLVEKTGYSENDLSNCIYQLHQIHWNTDPSSNETIANTCKNLIKKYNQKFFCQVSSTVMAVSFDHLWLGWKEHMNRMNLKEQLNMKSSNVTNSRESFLSPVPMDNISSTDAANQEHKEERSSVTSESLNSNSSTSNEQTSSKSSRTHAKAVRRRPVNLVTV